MAMNLVKRRHPCAAAVRNLTIKKVMKYLSRILWEFCSFTSLHGMRNLVSDVRYLNKSSTQERFSRKYSMICSYYWPYVSKRHLFRVNFSQATDRGNRTEFRNMGWCIHCWCGICTHNDHVDLATLSNDPDHHDDWNVLLSDLECTISGRHHL